MKYQDSGKMQNKIRIRRKKKYAYPTQTKVEERFTATKGGGERKI
jgi:hypothetical protein